MPDEMVLHIEEIEDDTKEIDNEGKPKCSRITRVMNGYTAKNDTDTHADVPTSEQGGISCSSLIVGSQIDKHGLHAREDVSVTQANNDAGTIKAYRVLHEGKKQIAEHADEDTSIDILYYPPLA